MSVVIIIGVIFISIVLALWIILPFAVFGIKARLDRIINMMEEFMKR